MLPPPPPATLFVFAIFGDVIVMVVKDGCEKCVTEDCKNGCLADAPVYRFLTEEKDTCKDFKFCMSLSL
jgi:hypothetical protein